MTDRGRVGADWSQMDKWMDSRFPFMNDKWKKRMANGNTDWVGDYVQDVLKRSFSEKGGAAWSEEGEKGTVSSQGELEYDYEVFETHNGVIVKVTVPDEVQIRNIRVYAGSMQLKLEQDPRRQKMFISLPTEVIASSVKASVKNRIMEIRCQKMDEAQMFQEVRIRYL